MKLKKKRDTSTYMDIRVQIIYVYMRRGAPVCLLVCIDHAYTEK